LRLDVNHALVVDTPGSTVRLTLSIGIACRRGGSEEEIGALVHRADLAMYQVKQAGRGHWRVAPDPDAPVGPAAQGEQ
jgi:diguanylate cyclase (GGDEF)-like protein